MYQLRLFIQRFWRINKVFDPSLKKILCGPEKSLGDNALSFISDRRNTHLSKRVHKGHVMAFTADWNPLGDVFYRCICLVFCVLCS